MSTTQHTRRVIVPDGAKLLAASGAQTPRSHSATRAATPAAQLARLHCLLPDDSEMTAPRD